jgi:hypothetical protein
LLINWKLRGFKGSYIYHIGTEEVRNASILEILEGEGGWKHCICIPSLEASCRERDMRTAFLPPLPSQKVR